VFELVTIKNAFIKWPNLRNNSPSRVVFALFSRYRCRRGHCPERWGSWTWAHAL
jgi:hypothetical protein